jgi:hypothetical protein
MANPKPNVVPFAAIAPRARTRDPRRESQVLTLLDERTAHYDDALMACRRAIELTERLLAEHDE